MTTLFDLTADAAATAQRAQELSVLAALSDLILQAARQAIPSDVEQLITLPDCGPRNKPLMPLLIGLVEALKVTAEAVADNAWDEGYPVDDCLTVELCNSCHSAYMAIGAATTAPTKKP